MGRFVNIYLDTNVFIAAFETAGARSDHAWWILEAAETGEFNVVTSELTLAELLVRPMRDHDAKLCKIYDDIIRSGDQIEVAPVTREILTEAARLRSGRSGLKLPDAIHCATALRGRCQAIITDDTRMPREWGVYVIPFGPSSLSSVRILL